MLNLLLKLFKKKKKKPQQLDEDVKQTHQQDTSTRVEQVEQQVRDWEELLMRVKAHPFSQFKIINDQLLMSIYKALKDIDKKLEKLMLLDEIYKILTKGKEEIKLTVRDKQTLRLLSQYGMMTAEEVAKKMNISRSTASLRLNKLFLMGLLDKKIENKKVFFFIKDQEKANRLLGDKSKKVKRQETTQKIEDKDQSQ